MPQQISGTVGPSATNAPDGLDSLPFRQGRTGEQIVSALHGKYYEQAARGNVYFITTVAAGLAIPITSTTSPILVLWNPSGSGKNAVLLRYGAAYVSGTSIATAIGLMYVTNAGNTVATGAVFTAFNAATPFNGVLGSGNPSAMRSSAAGTNTLTTASTNWAITLAGESALIATTAMNPYSVVYDFDGAIIVPPGVAVFPAGTAATGALLSQTLMWEEVPILS